jgi:pimeloyl-ACP methyl ester carboxylesterase
MSEAFAERRIEADGTPVRCFEAGQGAVVLGLHGEAGTAPTALEKMLSDKFRVIVLESPAFATRAPHEAAHLVARVARELGLEHYALLAGPSATATGLSQALEGAAQVEALVLVSPSTHADLEARLGDIKVTTLVLAGTKDKPAVSASARRLADRMRDCYFMVVYDAGPAMEDERPAALFEAVADFIERRGRFVLERQDSALSP